MTEENFDTKVNPLSNAKKFKRMIGRKFTKNMIRSVFHVDDGQADEDQDEDSTVMGDDDEPTDDLVLANEIRIVDNFLSRFLLSSETAKKNMINLKLAMKALPKRINEVNVDRLELMNFSLIQMSIIGFQNDDKDELMNYYDRRNQRRLLNLRTNSAENSEKVRHIEDVVFKLTKLASSFIPNDSIEYEPDDTSGYGRTYSDSDF